MLYLGLDTSSKAIHGVVLDEDENLINIYKATCNTKDSFKKLFPDLMDNFARVLIEEIDIDTLDYAMIEEPIRNIGDGLRVVPDTVADPKP